MIDVNELRICNLVKIKTSNDAAYYPIYAIDGMGLKVILGSTRQCEGWKDVSLLKPIPITEKVLLKCGMEEYNEDSSIIKYGYRCDEFRICIVVTGTNRYILHIHNLKTGEQICGKEIQYLHQLQNIYFDLIGKELEVSL